MATRLEIDGEVYEFTEAVITFGTDAGCTVLLPESEEMTPCHAAIRKISGRWCVEVRDASFIQVGDEPKSRMYWLNEGDVIRMTDFGPIIKFEPTPPKFAPVRATSGESSPTRPERRSKATTSEVSERRQTSKSRPKVTPPVDEEIIELEVVEQEPVPRRPPGKARPQPTVRDEEAVPAIKTETWTNSASAATAERQRRARRNFWLQIGVGGTLALVAVATWKYGLAPAGDSPARPAETVVAQPTPPATPVDSPQTVARNTPATIKTPAKPIDTPVVAKVERPTNVVTEPKTVEPASPVAKVEPVKTVPAIPVSEDILAAISPAIFTVLAKRPNEEGYVLLGTAWVASRRHLVTSGAVAMAADDLRREGMSISVSRPSLKAPVRIKDVRVHDAYRQGIERAAKAREQIEAAKTAPPVSNPDPADIPPEIQLAQALSSQVRFDLGVLEVATGQRLPSALPINSSDLPDVTNVEYTMVGSPFSSDNSRIESHADVEPALGRVNPVGTAVKSDKTLSLTMPFSGDVVEVNWSGSPVLDSNRRVIGVYSRPSDPDGKQKSPRQHAVIWLGRLREFAPEVEE